MESAAPVEPQLQLPIESAPHAVAISEPALPAIAEPVHAAPTPARDVPPPPAAPVQPAAQDLDEMLKESGLQMVQTKQDAKSEVAPEPEFVPAKRPRRPPPDDLGQPLQMVETRKES